jgi:DNA-binding HxlR family transcriptional regulator
MVRDVWFHSQTSRTTAASGPQHVAAADAALRHGGVRLVDPVEGEHLGHPGRELAGGGALQQSREPAAVRHHADCADLDAALGRRRGRRLHADEQAAVTDQTHGLLLQHRPVGHRVPAAARLGGEVGAERRLSDKWVTLVLVALHDQPRRYSQLARTIAGVSQKMLTQTLRTLERDGLLTRTVTASVPVTVTYELTDLGRSLLVVITGLKDWAEAHMDEVLAARDSYDAQP